MLVTACAKINLYLKITHPRPDGFHELRTLFQTVGLADEVELELLPSGDILFSCDNPEVPVGESNLCVQAALALRGRAGTGAGARIHLRKRIPMGGGLGGGSADAAAVLAGLDRLWETRLPRPDLLELAAGLGADVPFFLWGGSALGFGRGEEVVPLPDVTSSSVLLILPPVAVNTGWAYRKLNFLLTKRGWPSKLSGLRELLSGIPISRSLYENDFEAAVFPEFPMLEEIRDRLVEVGAATALMSGSGSTLFGLFESDEECRKALDRLLTAGVPGRLEVTRFVSRSEYRSAFPSWS